MYHELGSERLIGSIYAHMTLSIVLDSSLSGDFFYSAVVAEFSVFLAIFSTCCSLALDGFIGLLQ